MGRPKGSKNKSTATLTKRNIDTPKALPQRGKEEEPETVVCKGPETIASGHTEPLLGWCKSCQHMASNSMTDGLCFTCHKEAEGFVFDGETKKWKVEKKKERK